MPTLDEQKLDFIDASFERLHELALDIIEKCDNGSDISCELESVLKIDADIKYLTFSDDFCVLTEDEQVKSMSDARAENDIALVPVNTFNQTFLRSIQQTVRQLQTTQINNFIQAEFASLLSKVLFVDNNGYTGTPVKGDITKPYQNYSTARADATSGDIFWILSDLDETITLLNGCTYVGNGCNIDNTSGGVLIQDAGVVVGCRMIGDFKLKDSMANITHSIRLTHSASELEFHGTIESSNTDNATRSIDTGGLTTGYLKFYGDIDMTGNSLLEVSETEIYGNVIASGQGAFIDSMDFKLTGNLTNNGTPTQIFSGCDSFVVNGDIEYTQEYCFNGSDNFDIKGNITPNGGLSVINNGENINITGNVTVGSNSFFTQNVGVDVNINLNGNLSLPNGGIAVEGSHKVNVYGNIDFDSSGGFWLISNSDDFFCQGNIVITDSGWLATNSDNLVIEGNVTGGTVSAPFILSCDNVKIDGDVTLGTLNIYLANTSQYITITGDITITNGNSGGGANIFQTCDYIKVRGDINGSEVTAFNGCDFVDVRGNITVDFELFNACNDVTVYGNIVQEGDTTTYGFINAIFFDTDRVQVYGNISSQVSGYDNGAIGFISCDNVILRGNLTTDGICVQSGVDVKIYGEVKRTDDVDDLGPYTFQTVDGLTVIGSVSTRSQSSSVFYQCNIDFLDGTLNCENQWSQVSSNGIFDVSGKRTRIGNLLITNTFRGTIFVGTSNELVEILGSVKFDHKVTPPDTGGGTDITVGSNVFIDGNVDSSRRSGKIRGYETFSNAMGNTERAISGEAYYVRFVVEDYVKYKGVRYFLSTVNDTTDVTVGVFDNGGTVVLESATSISQSAGYEDDYWDSNEELYLEPGFYWLYIHVESETTDHEWLFFDRTLADDEVCKVETIASAPSSIGSTSATQYVPWIKLF